MIHLHLTAQEADELRHVIKAAPPHTTLHLRQRVLLELEAGKHESFAGCPYSGGCINERTCGAAHRCMWNGTTPLGKTGGL